MVKTYQVNEVGKFWVVTYPTMDSTLDDIVFETTPVGMMFQTLGGLSPKDIAGIFKHRSTAVRIARKLMERN